MFTGLIAGTGRIRSVARRGLGLAVVIEHRLGEEPIALGESIAVDGCCLTAVAAEAGRFDAELSPETLRRTGGSARWRLGRGVNLERSLRAGDRMGGHVVLGHADRLCRLVSLRSARGGWQTAEVALDAADRRWVVEKGSVALDGVSLTVAGLTRDGFFVALIPATLAATTWRERRAGDRLITEFDILAKYAQAGRAG